MKPETLQLIGKVLLAACGLGFVVWGAITTGFWPDLGDKQAGTAWQMHTKHSPRWWQSLSRWFLLGLVALFLVGFFLSGPRPVSLRKPLLKRLFGGAK